MDILSPMGFGRFVRLFKNTGSILVFDFVSTSVGGFFAIEHIFFNPTIQEVDHPLCISCNLFLVGYQDDRASLLVQRLARQSIKLQFKEGEYDMNTSVPSLAFHPKWKQLDQRARLPTLPEAWGISLPDG